ncbi:tryptophan--tRNA ligase [Spiroplasma endosymbiont of Notiophilus biguttatus]|uniref:tryptophan--tRNA ligase n=1 Tax=Spiroplasma endosymbiont of Notiophilus biguttatus TaxID=3066285 RepID=UPI00313F3236
MARIISGITSTGKLTLGNYLGAINNFLKLQEEHELLIFVANLHGLTLPIKAQELRKNIKDIAAWYFAAGIIPNKSHIFIQSDVLAHSQLGYILLCNSYVGELERMTQFKDKSQKMTNQQNKTISIPTGILTYPALMAADILLYDADFVPVGVDQTQHLELTKTLATRMNNNYKTDLFKIPKIIIDKQAQKIMSLQEPEKKMSKSDTNLKNTIFLSDSKQEVTNKIKKAVTDSENIIKFDPEHKPGVSNLLTIYSSITKKDIKTCEQYFSNHNYGFLKEEVIKAINDLLEPMQKKHQEFINEKTSQLAKYLEEGANFANNIATKKLNFVQDTMGINFIEKER